jgi:hypothetical protein
MIQRRTGMVPATAEEAVSEYSQMDGVPEPRVPAEMLEKFRRMDLDALLKTMSRESFAEMWPLLSQGLHRATGE